MKRFFSTESITIESEIVNIKGQQFTFNGVPIVGTGISVAPVGAAPNANAATVTGSVLNLQPASAAFPGVVTTGAQTFAGVKNFQDGLTLAGSSAINSLAVIGAAPNANAASIVGSALNLQPASAAFGGVVTTGAQTFAGLKNFQDGFQVGGSTLAFQSDPPQACTPALDAGAITTHTGSASFTASLVGTLKSVFIAPFLVTANTGSPTNLFYNSGNLLPVAYRPFTSIFFNALLIDATANQVEGYCVIGNDGSIHFRKLDNSVFTSTFGVQNGTSFSYNA
jgi:hypothetical protein